MWQTKKQLQWNRSCLHRNCYSWHHCEGSPQPSHHQRSLQENFWTKTIANPNSRNTAINWDFQTYGQVKVSSPIWFYNNQGYRSHTHHLRSYTHPPLSVRLLTLTMHHLRSRTHPPLHVGLRIITHHWGRALTQHSTWGCVYWPSTGESKYVGYR